MSSLYWPSRPRRDPRVPACGDQPVVTQATVVSHIWAPPTLTVTFDVPVSLTGLPAWPLSTGATPSAASRQAPKVIAATYVAYGLPTSWSVQKRDPAVRTSIGGYADHGTFRDPAASNRQANFLLRCHQQNHRRIRFTDTINHHDRLRLDSVCLRQEVHHRNRANRVLTVTQDHPQLDILQHRHIGPIRLLGRRQPCPQYQWARTRGIHHRMVRPVTAELERF